MEVPGETPTSPPTTLLVAAKVIAAPAWTAKFSHTLSDTAVSDGEDVGELVVVAIGDVVGLGVGFFNTSVGC